MILPLYEAAAHQPPVRIPDGHAGLWFDKFCNQWRVDGSLWMMKSDKEDRRAVNPKLEWLKSLTAGKVGASSQIDEYGLRLARLIVRRGGSAEVFVTESRFVSGLGRGHPVENGFAWHPTLGTPFLPGSSVKGLVRSWAETDADPRPDSDMLARLLGKPGEAGGVCFLDAVPTAPVQLEADIMTPHYAGWSEHDPPGDWRSPDPIPFLTTAAGTPFLFGLIPGSTVTRDGPGVVSTWLRAALAWAGGGARTAIGYGRFRADSEQTNRWRQRLKDEDRKRREERERQEAMKSPEGRWRMELRGLSEPGILDLVRIHLDKEPLEDPVERRAFAEAVMATGVVSGWRRGVKREPRTNVGKKILRERARLVQGALEAG